jgi:5,10-methylenetetrahydromethanopterin reductase
VNPGAWDDPRWGVWLHADRPLAVLGSVAARAEAVGAAAILVADEGTDRDLYVTLATLATRTQRVLLFGAVTNPHSRHPVATAAAYATVAELAPGRIVAGFGTGGSRVLGPMRLDPKRPFTALRECVEVFEALVRGEHVRHDGEFRADAQLTWTTAPLPIAIAGRGPRVERFAAERADWLLLAGRPIAAVAELVERLRSVGMAARGRSASMAWNPNVAWTEGMQRDLRAHLAYMAVDMPAAERAMFGLDDARTVRLRDAVNGGRMADAAELLPSAVLDRYAVSGSRSAVVGRLAALRREVRPELFVFDAYDYSEAFVDELAAVASEAGIAERL